MTISKAQNKPPLQQKIKVIFGSHADKVSILTGRAKNFGSFQGLMCIMNKTVSPQFCDLLSSIGEIYSNPGYSIG